ncbi:MAG TPA: hypothetical protein VGS18_04700, partial [Thermoplasmata archaeon]|nr:hypothetical protein [Thermoplasmata archaeon]
GSIPFVVVNGQYFHVGSLVNPSPLEGFSAIQITGQLNNQTGGAWADIQPAADLLTAILLKTDGGQPSALLSNVAIAQAYAQLS